MIDSQNGKHQLIQMPVGCCILTSNSKYPEAKLQENLDSEIMEVLLQEAHESYDEEIVVELRSDTAEELDANVDRIEAWIKQWGIERGKSPS
jgi:broad-specificity NMP kinase